MNYVKSPKVYVCCGQYYACNDYTKDKQIICTRCQEVIKTPIKTPKIVLVQK